MRLSRAVKELLITSPFTCAPLKPIYGERPFSDGLFSDGLILSSLSSLTPSRLYNLFTMDSPLLPIYLFADSQLLFWSGKGDPFLKSVIRRAGHAALKAAYIGASNGDDPRFYSIFEAAMESVDILDRRMILSSFSREDELFVNESDIILLAGGDVERGWNAFTRVGLNELIIRRYYEGALLIGISAGAIQLGMFGLIEAEASINKLIDTFKLVPFIVSAHDEKQDWESLKRTLQLLDGDFKGVGIPTGGGLIYHPDQTVEPVRHPLYEFSIRDGLIDSRLLAPY